MSMGNSSISTIWYNGSWHTDHQDVLCPRDRVRYGDGVFDTMLVINGDPIYPARHFARLQRHAEIMGIHISLDQNQHFDIVQDLLTRNQAYHGHWAVNSLLTRGLSARGLMPPDHDQQNPSFVIMAAPAPYPHEFPQLHAHITHSVRRNEGSPLSQIKSCNYGDNIYALNEARKAGANEVILLNNQDRVTCASSGNIIVRLDGRFYTPPLRDGVMDGTIRSALISSGAALERCLYEEDLRSAEAVFIANSIRGIAPIATLDKSPLSTVPFLDYSDAASANLDVLARIMGGKSIVEDECKADDT